MKKIMKTFWTWAGEDDNFEIMAAVMAIAGFIGLALMSIWRS